MGYQIEYAYTSHIGRIRANNEDNFWCLGETMTADNQGTEGVRAGTAVQAQFPLMAVFDGMGGESCGEMAAFLAADACGRHYSEHKHELGSQPEQFLEELCRQMNRSVFEYSVKNKIRTMGTTAAMLAIGEESAYACNLGDSRLYLSQQGKFHQISSDHVLKGGFFCKPPLTQYVGMDDAAVALEPHICRMECSPGSRYLICSDGMTDMLSDGEMADILAREIPVQETAEILLERALGKGGRDNITLILCEVKEEKKKRFFQWLESRRKTMRGDKL